MAAATAPRTDPSIRSCRTSRARRAPIADSTAISATRPVPRASRRFTRLAAEMIIAVDVRLDLMGWHAQDLTSALASRGGRRLEAHPRSQTTQRPERDLPPVGPPPVERGWSHSAGKRCGGPPFAEL